MSIKDYSTTPASNTSLFPEGMNPAAVNNGMRQVQADIREAYNTPQWRDLGNSVTYASATTFTIAGDVTANYIATQRIRCYGTVMGTLYGSIVSSAYSAPNTTVTVSLDSGSLTSNLSAVALGIDPTNDPIPVEAIKGTGVFATTAGANAFSGDNTHSGTETFTGKIITPDEGELTIASGAITVAGVYHTVDTESDAASDDLVTINGGADGQELILRAENTGRDVVLKTSGNISLPSDITLSDDTTAVHLKYDGALTKWLQVGATAAQGRKADTAVQPGDLEAPITLGTPTASTSGTSIDFTSPITTPQMAIISFAGVSINGSDNLLIQLGDAGGVETSGYLGASVQHNGSGNSRANFTSGFGIRSASGSNILHGSIILNLLDASTFSWVANGTLTTSAGSPNADMSIQTAGSKSLTAALDRVRITTDGSSTFDTGKINVSWL